MICLLLFYTFYPLLTHGTAFWTMHKHGEACELRRLLLLFPLQIDANAKTDFILRVICQAQFSFNAATTEPEPLKIHALRTL